jgi:PTS system nitrogen regulatory IIA component
MKPLAELLGESRIRLDSSAEVSGAVMGELAELLGGSDAAVREAVLDGLVSRERVSSTAVGGGVAFPHARIDILPGIRLAFLRTRTPVEFSASDGKKVDLFVAVAGPGPQRREYLSVLSRLSYLFRSERLRERFRSVGDPAELLQLVRDSEQSPRRDGE